MRRLLATAVLATIGFSAAAGASGPTIPMAPKTFARADADKNGKLTLAELSPPAERRFLKLDADGDKAVSRAEIEASLMAALQKRVARMLDQMDADKDGTITQGELDGLMKAKFAKADANADGELTLEEAQAYKLASRQEMRQLWLKQRREKATP